MFNILGTAFDYFTIWLLIGLLVWNLFNSPCSPAPSISRQRATWSTRCGSLARCCPLASVGAALVHFFLQSIVLVVVLAVLRYNVDWSYMWLLPFALVTLLVFAAALGRDLRRHERVPA